MLLNQFDEISAATHYKYNGELHTELPYDLCEVPVEPVYKSFIGWRENLNDISDYEDLPENAKAYVLALEKYFKVPITMISTGPERSKLILKETEGIGV